MRDGMVITSATRSILDAAEAGSAPEQMEMAIIQAVQRGQVIPEELGTKATERGRRVSALVAGALQMMRVAEREEMDTRSPRARGVPGGVIGSVTSSVY